MHGETLTGIVLLQHTLKLMIYLKKKRKDKKIILCYQGCFLTDVLEQTKSNRNLFKVTLLEEPAVGTLGLKGVRLGAAMEESSSQTQSGDLQVCNLFNTGRVGSAC